MNSPALSEQYPKISIACATARICFPEQLAAQHPQIVAKLESLWGTRDGVLFLDNLVFSDRPDRIGFSFDVVRDLFALKDAHESLYPQLASSPNDPFASKISVAPRDDIEHMRQAANRHEKKKADRAVGAAPPVFFVAKPKAAVATKNSGEAEKALPGPRQHAPWPEVADLDELLDIARRRAKGERLPVRDTRQMLEILREYVGLTEEEIDYALGVQKQVGRKLGPVGKVLLSMGVVESEHVTRVLCMQYGILMVNLPRFQMPPEIMKQVSLEVARKYRAVPVAAIDGTLFLAVENPFGFEQREYFGFLTKLKVELVMASAAQIGACLDEGAQSVRTVQQGDREFRSLASQALAVTPEDVGEIVAEETDDNGDVSQNDATIVGLVNKIIADAAAIGASDIHIESFPGEPLARIRFRRDGRMEEYSQYSASYHRAVVSRIKIMAALNIAERRMAQDGKITFSRAGKQRIDLRVATIPTVRGIENVTIRLLHTGEPIPLDRLDMGERDLAVFRRLLAKPYGLLLVCGPTGSGKTTTLHSALRELNRPESKIWTAEDPIEIVQKNICQVQVNPQIGWTFAMALRSFLRADPDIIMVGEMRDMETAGIAIEASMTGHLVLSTLHTNSASETAARLLDLGVDPFNLADALTGVLAQRLARRLCPHCAQREETDHVAIEELAAEFHFSACQRLPSKAEKDAIVRDWKKRLGKEGTLGVWTAKGCEKCGMEGYKGRVALFELLEVTPRIRELVAHKSSAAELHRAAIEQGMRSLKQDGIEKMLLGLTDMNQVRAVCA